MGFFRSLDTQCKGAILRCEVHQSLEQVAQHHPNFGTDTELNILLDVELNAVLQVGVQFVQERLNRLGPSVAIAGLDEFTAWHQAARTQFDFALGRFGCSAWQAVGGNQ